MTEDYEAFVDKFKPKKTSDDCYTPINIYNAVAGWVEKEYGVSWLDFVRPFYPGGDYENQVYLPGQIVVDNPPFSIITKICRFYDARGIKYFLFAPTLTCFQSLSDRNSAIVCGVQITYHNGAKVNTSFLTNLDSCRCRTAPELNRIVKEQDEKNLKKIKKQRPKYIYPDHVITSAMMEVWSRRGVDFQVSREESTSINALDSQKAVGKEIFGKGYLLSDHAAAAAAAAERQTWELSEREKRIVAGLQEAKQTS